MTILRKTNLKILRSRFFQQLIFWGISFGILLHLFTITDSFSRLDLIYTILFHIGLLTGVYLNIFLLIPVFLKRERYLLYGITVVMDVFLAAGLSLFVFEYLSDILFPGYYIISGYSIFGMAKFQLIYIGLTTLLELSLAWFRLAESEKKLMQIEKEKTSVELQALKSQVNPHFFFNSLNNLYSLTLNKSDDAPDMILRLSSLMRYILYDASDKFVPLQKEIDCINDYLKIQNLRIDKERTKIRFEVKGKIKKQVIAPLIFLPFIENSYKHGAKGKINNSFIKILLSVNEKQINFLIINNKGEAVQVEKKKDGGLGLENVKKRLDLIYPGRHTIDINDSSGLFEVDLKLRC